MNSPVELTWLLLGLAWIFSAFWLWLLRKRRPAADRGSAVWVIACEEKKTDAVVQFRLLKSGPAVADCSMWAEGACRKSCVERLRSRSPELISHNCRS